MCDTLGRISGTGLDAIFAKNSDRSPNEPQVVEWYPEKQHDENMVKATYIEIEQVERTHAFILSRPIWLWGGEMGVNDCGVCIGNEAVFTKGKYSQTGLTGMDLLRLGLERGSDAAGALKIIIKMLEKYGQGGNCGYDHDFYYDNSFLIMDRQELYILETAGKEWVYRKQDNGCISNRLALEDGDMFSGESCNFKNKHFEPVYSRFSGSKQRLKQTRGHIDNCTSVKQMINALKTHEKGSSPLIKGSVRSTCMHTGGLVGDHTTSSMVVTVSDTPTIWLTGCSTPCISLFKPYKFGGEPVAPVFMSGDKRADEYWRERESFHRSVISKRMPDEFCRELEAIQNRWIDEVENQPQSVESISETALGEEKEFYKKWVELIPAQSYGSRRFKSYWVKKNKALDTFKK